MQYGGQELKKLQNAYVPPLISNEEVLNYLKKVYIIDKPDKLEINGYWVNVYKLEKRKG